MQILNKSPNYWQIPRVWVLEQTFSFSPILYAVAEGRKEQQVLRITYAKGEKRGVVLLRALAPCHCCHISGRAQSASPCDNIPRERGERAWGALPWFLSPRRGTRFCLYCKMLALIYPAGRQKMTHLWTFLDAFVTFQALGKRGGEGGMFQKHGVM